MPELVCRLSQAFISVRAHYAVVNNAREKSGTIELCWRYKENIYKEILKHPTFWIMRQSLLNHFFLILLMLNVYCINWDGIFFFYLVRYFNYRNCCVNLMIIFNINNIIITKSTLSTTHKIKFYIYIPTAITVYFEKKRKKKKNPSLVCSQCSRNVSCHWPFAFVKILFIYLHISVLILTTQPPCRVAATPIRVE